MKGRPSSTFSVRGKLEGRHTELSDDEPFRRLLAGLPGPVRHAVAWLRRPRARWLRLPLGLVLIFGGLLGFLPILGFWMIPLGALLLAEDIPALRRPTMRALGAMQGWWERRRERIGRR
jgi:hypothetical protein